MLFRWGQAEDPGTWSCASSDQHIFTEDEGGEKLTKSFNDERAYFTLRVLLYLCEEEEIHSSDNFSEVTDVD